jgi:hypothetical protein
VNYYYVKVQLQFWECLKTIWAPNVDPELYYWLNTTRLQRIFSSSQNSQREAEMWSLERIPMIIM